MLEHLQEDPLGPLVVVGVGGVDAAVPIKAVAQHLQLAGEVGDVLLGDDGRVDMVLDGVVLRGQAEGIEADGVQHVVALHPLFAGDDVHGREGPGMAHMEALTGGVGELDEAVELGALVPGDGGVGLGLLPTASATFSQWQQNRTSCRFLLLCYSLFLTKQTPPTAAAVRGEATRCTTLLP